MGWQKAHPVLAGILRRRGPRCFLCDRRIAGRPTVSELGEFCCQSHSGIYLSILTTIIKTGIVLASLEAEREP